MSTKLFAGLTGFTLARPDFDLGGGLHLDVTFGHLFSPFMMAFKPAKPGGMHPAPWAAVSSGSAWDMHVQLSIEHAEDESPEVVKKSEESAWLIATLLRLQLDPRIRFAILMNKPIDAAHAQDKDLSILAFEVAPAPLLRQMGPPRVLDVDGATWLKSHWLTARKLIRESREFSVLMEAYSQCSWSRSVGLALVELWGALQRVFTQAHQEAALRLSSMMGAYLEPPGNARRELVEKIADLYGERGKGAHGGRNTDVQILFESANIATRAILKIVEEGKVPSVDELKSSLYGAD